MRRIRLLAVGRRKTPHWRDAASYYLKRLAHTRQVEETVVKDADASAPLDERKESEGERLLKTVRPQDVLIAMDEGGKCMPSRDFAAFLRQLHDSGKVPCFVVGGAYGLSDALLRSAGHRLSLGPMTLPHELARVVLLEQLYRAENILSGTGYHH